MITHTILFAAYEHSFLIRRYLAANGAIMRTSIVGALQFNGRIIVYCCEVGLMCVLIMQILRP